MKYILLILTIVYLVFSILQARELKGADLKWGIPGVLMEFAAAVILGIGTYMAFCDVDNLIGYIFSAPVLSTVGGYLCSKSHGVNTFREDILPMLIGIGIACVLCIIIL